MIASHGKARAAPANAFRPRRLILALVGVGTLVLAGCATVDINQAIARAGQDSRNLTGGKLSLARTDRERSERQSAAAAILGKPLTADDAVHLALINSPAMQALLAQNWADAAMAAQSGRLPNPLLTLDWIRSPGTVEVGRMLGVGLLDILALPRRRQIAQSRLEQGQLQLTSDIVDKVVLVRQAWVNAVGAQQSLSYAKQVSDSAEASAELARRMLEVLRMQTCPRLPRFINSTDATIGQPIVRRAIRVDQLHTASSQRCRNHRTRHQSL